MLVAVISWAGQVLAGDPGPSPFSDEAEVERIRLAEPAACHTTDATVACAVRVFVLREGDREYSLRVVKHGEGLGLDLEIDGRPAIPRSAFSPFDFHAGVSARSADLNRDGVPDFIVYSFSGGCGLAAGECNIAFILSDADGYRPTVIQTLFPDERSFVILGGTPCFIRASFFRVDRCLDGKPHNFWGYGILAFDGGRVVVRNDLHPGFPRTVWFTHRPNHTETRLLTAAHKATLHRDAERTLIWNPE